MKFYIKDIVLIDSETEVAKGVHPIKSKLIYEPVLAKNKIKINTNSIENGYSFTAPLIPMKNLK